MVPQSSVSSGPILERNKSSMSAVVARGKSCQSMAYSAAKDSLLLGCKFSTRTERCEPAIGRDILRSQSSGERCGLLCLDPRITPNNSKSAMAALGNQETLQKINAALAVFATSTNKAQISQANDWLQDFQHTVSRSPVHGATRH